MSKYKLVIKKIALLGIVGLLASCGGGGSGSSSTTTTTTTPTTISGKAEAPGGVIAQLETSKPFLLATMDFVFPAAGAAITGLQPVGGATVELIRIDNDGNQVGAVLASTVTSISGNYSLALPTGVSLAGDLVVRISGTTASMSAMVVDQTVNINPISQFVLDKFVDVPNLILADLAINEVVSLSGQVEEFDLTATADLSTMLAQLEAETGQFIDTAIAVIDATPDDGTASAAVAGNWHFIGFDLGMEDQDDSLFAALLVSVFAEAGSPIIDDGNGDLSLGSGLTLIDSFTDYAINAPANRGFGYGIDINIAGDSELTPAVIDADGNISLSFPFEEDLDDGGPDGPDFGTRSPPGIFYLNAVANGNTYIFNPMSAAVGYGTIDTNNDGVKDAINPADRKADILDASLGILLKQGSGMTAASLNGDFGFVSLAAFLDTSPQGIFESIVGEINLNNGTVTIQDGAQDTRQVIRTPITLTNVTLTDNVVPEGADTFPYTVSDTGQVTLGNDSVPGLSNNDGSVMAFVASETLGNPINDVANWIDIHVKLGTNMASSLNDATYQLYPLVYDMRTDGYSAIRTLGHGSVAVFNAGATTFSVNGTDRGFSRSTDLSQISPLISVDPADAVFTVDPIAANGAIAMSLTDGTGTDTLKGFVSADSNLLILRVLGNDIGERAIGLVIGIKSGGSATAAATVVRSADLTGGAENPPVVTAATGRGAVVVNPTTMEITGGITFTGLTPSLGGHHIHRAPIGDPTANGSVIINLLLASDSETAVVPPNTMLSQAEYDALLAGELYFNVHTAANSGGEIRGQINVSGSLVAAVTSLNGTQEVPPVTTSATGKGTLVVDDVTGDVLISYVTHEVANANAAHIHAGLGPGTNGAPIVTFSTLDTNFDSAGTNLAAPPAGAQMTAGDVSDFLINYLYFNVHSTGNPGGEIRGDITALP